MCDPKAMYLEVKVSDIPFAGLGLFATDTIEPGQIICEYEGRFYAKDHPSYETCMHLDTALQTPAGVIVGTGGFGHFANDILHMSESVRQNRPIYRTELQYNAVFNNHHKYLVHLVAIKRILPGQEIFVCYGNAYWIDKLKPFAPDPKDEIKNSFFLDLNDVVSADAYWKALF